MSTLAIERHTQNVRESRSEPTTTKKRKKEKKNSNQRSKSIPILAHMTSCFMFRCWLCVLFMPPVASAASLSENVILLFVTRYSYAVFVRTYIARIFRLYATYSSINKSIRTFAPSTIAFTVYTAHIDDNSKTWWCWSCHKVAYSFNATGIPRTIRFFFERYPT